MTAAGTPGGRDGAEVTVRYWAGARAAAGRESDVVAGTRTVGEALDAVTALHPALAAVAAVSTLLLDGRSVGREAATGSGAVLEVLPPFAGG
jgi:sulfur-carrier protein